MKSTAVAGCKIKEPQYPVLMIGNIFRGTEEEQDIIVIFAGLCEGVVVHHNGPQYGHVKVGNYSSAWIECTDPKHWTEYTGEVTLSN